MIGIVLGKHDANTLAQLADVNERAEHTALMADGHLGHIMPVGGVAAYDNKVSVAGVGFDIACGNAAIRTDLKYDGCKGCMEAVADEIANTISFGVGRKNDSEDAPKFDSANDCLLWDDPAWDAVPKPHREGLKQKAAAQLGTVGSGNHYVDIFEDEAGFVWVGVHFGSRGFGHTVASGFMAMAQREPWDKRGEETETLLSLDGGIGADYWALMELAGRYAYVGREWVARKVVSILGAKEVELVHNHHNFAWRERHFGRDLIVVRKGATPAFPWQKGFVGGSMGDDAVILQGRELPPGSSEMNQQTRSLYSTVHGAGRVMSRSEAAGNRKGTKKGKVTPEMMREWIGARGVILRGGGLDESPHAYRRLPDVLAAQGSTVEVLHRLRPVVVVMAGANEFDPYKD